MESMSDTTETAARPAHSAVSSGGKNETSASPSQSTATAQRGSATTADGQAVSATGLDHARSRGISPETLDSLGVKSGTAGFREGKAEALFWPYVVDGEVVNWKATRIGEKGFTGMPGGRMCVHHLDELTSETLYIVEGEWDMASLVEAGVPLSSVTTIPNGAQISTAEGDETPSGYLYAEELLERTQGTLKRIVWCGDMDGPGLGLRHVMAKIFGAARFHFVDWPEGCKDANDMLLADGPEAVFDLVTNGFLPWPVDGLYRMNELPEPPPIQTWEPGFPEWENKIRLSPGMLSVCTGHPGHGKTHLFSQIWYQVARAYQVKVAIASFETRAKPHHQRVIRTLMSGKLEKDMSDAERRWADDWINDAYLWIQEPLDKPATLEWLLDRAEVAVVRHGCRVVQIDPWNRLEGQRARGESETDYIGRCLSAIYKFAQQMDCHVQILAHPAKMDGKFRGNAPALEDISGSKNWDNRVDQGFVVHRPNMTNDDGTRATEAVLIQRKARFEELGYPCSLDLRLNLERGRYESIDYETQFERDMA